MKLYLKRISFENINDFLDFYGEGVTSFLENINNLENYGDISKFANKTRYESLKLLGYKAFKENGRIVYRKFFLPLVDEEERKL